MQPFSCFQTIKFGQSSHQFYSSALFLTNVRAEATRAMCSSVPNATTITNTTRFLDEKMQFL